MSDAVQAGDYDQGSGDLLSGTDRARAANSSRANTSIGGDCWPLNEYAMADKGDLDRFGGYAARWKNQCIAPVQYLLNIMSMVPKKAKGEFQTIASMASGWRIDTKLDSPGERA